MGDTSLFVLDKQINAMLDVNQTDNYKRRTNSNKWTWYVPHSPSPYRQLRCASQSQPSNKTECSLTQLTDLEHWNINFFVEYCQLIQISEKNMFKIYIYMNYTFLQASRTIINV